MKHKVSVVVPVYNVEKYLRQCIESLAGQDYENYEVILVNDGSTDSSGSICNDAADQYANFKVIHQENQGLSGARNSGIRCAQGIYIAFVDSDDWVSSNYISYQMNLMEQRQADVVALRQQSIWYGSNPEPICFENEKVEVFNTSEAIKEMCYGYKFGASACKLFKTEMVKKNLFPVGVLYEDLAVMYKIIGSSSKVVYSNLPMYYYRRRPASIINQVFNEKHLSILVHAEKQLEYVLYNFPRAKHAAYFKSAYVITQIMPMVVRSARKDIYKDLRKRMYKYFKYVIFNVKVKMKYKIRCTSIILGYVFAKAEIDIEQYLKNISRKQLDE